MSSLWDVYFLIGRIGDFESGSMAEWDIRENVDTNEYPNIFV